MPAPRRIAARTLAAALALFLSFETAPARAAPSPRDFDLFLSFKTSSTRAAPSPRDLAYEQGVQAEEAGDLEAAAARFAEAYRLTPPAETGPRLLFLRAAVAARLRAHERTPDDPRHLCEARALLRDVLGDAPPAAGADPLAPERESLARIDAQLAGVDCPDKKPVSSDTSSSDAHVPEDSSRPDVAPVSGDTSNTADRPAPGDSPADRSVPGDISSPPADTTSPAPAAPDNSPLDRRRRRALVGAGAAGLALGAAGFVVMGVGVVIARDATRDGREQCWNKVDGCMSNADGVPGILARGRLGDQLVKAGAAIGGLATLAGVVLLALSARARPSARVAVTPRLVLEAGTRGPPTALGLGLSGRF